jgi:hypothetical protein
MVAVTNLLKLPLLRSVYRAFALGLVLYFCADILFVAWHFSLMGDPEAPTEYANGIALGVGALLCLTIGHQHRLWSTARLFWTLVAFAVLLLAANEMFDLPARIDRAWADDGYWDLFILAVTPIGLYLACIFEAAPRLPVLAMATGFFFQCLSDVLDLVDDGFDRYWDRRVTDMLNDLSQLIFIEAYLFGLLCLLLILLARRFLRSSRDVSGVGQP